MAGTSQLAGSANAIVLGTVLDGIPESFVLGASLAQDGVVPIAVVVGVFASNVPEALSGTTGLLRSRVDASPRLRHVVGRRRRVGRGLGARIRLLDAMGSDGGAFALAFAAGAVLVMLADTLMPEAFELGGREAGLLTALGFALGVLPLLGAKERPRQTGRSAVALLRDLLAAVDGDVDPGPLHAATRLRIAVERERLPRPERENVRPLCLELLVGHLDDRDAAIREELEESHGRDSRIDEREIAVERRDERHEVHDLAAAVPVREVERDHVDPWETRQPVR